MSYCELHNLWQPSCLYCRLDTKHECVGRHFIVTLSPEGREKTAVETRKRQVERDFMNGCTP